MTFHFPDIRTEQAEESAAARHDASAVRAPTFSIRLLPDRGQLRVVVAGFWDEAGVEVFAAELHAAVVALRRAPGTHDICCDLSDAAIQPQLVVKALRDLIAHGPTQARKLAFFTTQPLSRMQARRIVDVRDNFAVFDNEADALAWLAE